MLPQKSWRKERYTKLIQNATKRTTTFTKIDNNAKMAIIYEDFNSKLNWENIKTKGTSNQWDDVLLQ